MIEGKDLESKDYYWQEPVIKELTQDTRPKKAEISKEKG